MLSTIVGRRWSCWTGPDRRWFEAQPEDNYPGAEPSPSMGLGRGEPSSPSNIMSAHTRREFVQRSILAWPAAVGLAAGARLTAAESKGSRSEKPDSKVAGVQIGLNVPYSFGKPQMSGDEILEQCVRLGLSAVELRTQPVEAFLGVALDLIHPKTSGAKGAAANAEPLRDWRRSVKMSRVKDFRTRYERAGVKIEIVKVDNIFKMADDEIDYAFGLAKALGGRAISTEISHEHSDLERLGHFADKHRFMVGYHGHASTTPAHWESAFSLARFNGANVDLGHFVAGNNASPVPFLKEHHSRVTHVHVKDRKRQNGPNTPFGEGDTPIAEVLRLIRDQRWNMQATIEFEYKIPANSDRITEIGRAIQFCRNALA